MCKDIEGREIVVGSRVMYAVSGKLVTGVVTDLPDEDHITVQKDSGKAATVAASDDKLYLLP